MDAGLRLIAHEACRVVDEVLKQLDEPQSVGADRRQISRDLHLDMPGVEPPDPREPEELVEEELHSLGGGLDPRHVLSKLFGASFLRVAGDVAEEAADRHQGALEVM